MPGYFITPNMAIHVDTLHAEALAIAKAGPSSPEAELSVKDLVNYAAVVHLTDAIISSMVASAA